jgi:hypothetical protein
MMNNDSSADNRAVLQAIGGYVLAVATFGSVYLLNARYHWVSRRVLLATAIGVGALMCIAGLLSALIARQKRQA